MAILIDHNSGRKALKRGRISVKHLKGGTVRLVITKHESALVQRQEQIRRDVPLASEKTLNLVFND